MAGDADPNALDTITIVTTGVSNMSAASAGDISQADVASQRLLLTPQRSAFL